MQTSYGDKSALVIRSPTTKLLVKINQGLSPTQSSDSKVKQTKSRKLQFIMVCLKGVYNCVGHSNDATKSD